MRLAASRGRRSRRQHSVSTLSIRVGQALIWIQVKSGTGEEGGKHRGLSQRIGRTETRPINKLLQGNWGSFASEH